jgi:hypothetical protein
VLLESVVKELVWSITGPSVSDHQFRWSALLCTPRPQVVRSLTHHSQAPPPQVVRWSGPSPVLTGPSGRSLRHPSSGGQVLHWSSGGQVPYWSLTGPSSGGQVPQWSLTGLSSSGSQVPQAHLLRWSGPSLVLRWSAPSLAPHRPLLLRWSGGQVPHQSSLAPQGLLLR